MAQAVHTVWAPDDTCPNGLRLLAIHADRKTAEAHARQVPGATTTPWDLQP